MLCLIKFNNNYYLINLNYGGMVEDYKSAAIRHLEDAGLLKLSGKPDNAGHLVGFAAECAIKYKIATLHSSPDNPHGHLPAFLTIARKHLGQRANYTGMYDILKNDIFQNWNVNRRYSATGTTSAAELEDWFLVTNRLFATAGIKVRQ